jgi:signal transduction histidine kinase
VFNLLLNACQAARRGAAAAVTLSLYEDQQWIRIRIADNGPGVPVSVRQKIFLPFVSEGRESGIGLGLTLAQQIAQEHGGSITLDQTSEGETAFTINLPKSSLDALGVVVESKTSPTYAPAKEKVEG